MLTEFASLILIIDNISDSKSLLMGEAVIIVATIITASPINNDLESEILSMINIKDANSVNITNVVNPNIIGGFIVRFDGKEYNASIKQNLNNLKTELTN